MAQLLVNHVFHLHGIPSDIISHRGLQFISQVWKALWAALGSTSSLTSEYHPQSNSQTERFNQELEASLRCVTNNNPSTCYKHLSWTEYTHNSHTSSAYSIPWLHPSSLSQFRNINSCLFCTTTHPKRFQGMAAN